MSSKGMEVSNQFEKSIQTDRCICFRHTRPENSIARAISELYEASFVVPLSETLIAVSHSNRHFLLQVL